MWTRSVVVYGVTTFCHLGKAARLSQCKIKFAFPLVSVLEKESATLPHPMLVILPLKK